MCSRMNVLKHSRITAVGLMQLCPRHVTFTQLAALPVLTHGHFVQKSAFHTDDRDRKHRKLVLQSSSNVANKLLGTESLFPQPDGISAYHTLQSACQAVIVTENDSRVCLRTSVRHKSKKQRRNVDDDGSDSEADDGLDEDDFEAPSQFKVQTIHAPSLRIDAVLSNSLGLSRHRLEETFFGPGILLNGQKVLKKGGKMDEGDYVDVIVDKSDSQVKVKRVKLLKIGSEKTGTDKFVLKVRTWKSPFLLDIPNKWEPKS